MSIYTKDALNLLIDWAKTWRAHTHFVKMLAIVSLLKKRGPPGFGYSRNSSAAYVLEILISVRI